MKLFLEALEKYIMGFLFVAVLVWAVAAASVVL